ncbi:hypothetical protein BUUB107078_28330 [Burkholderia ubonensis]|nr:hypothetical protein BUB20358_04083 [Burkholderia ubonensis]
MTRIRRPSSSGRSDAAVVAVVTAAAGARRRARRQSSINRGRLRARVAVFVRRRRRSRSAGWGTRVVTAVCVLHRMRLHRAGLLALLRGNVRTRSIGARMRACCDTKRGGDRPCGGAVCQIRFHRSPPENVAAHEPGQDVPRYGTPRSSKYRPPRCPVQPQAAYRLRRASRRRTSAASGRRPLKYLLRPLQNFQPAHGAHAVPRERPLHLRTHAPLKERPT